MGNSSITRILRATFLHCSMVTLTTLGYGDIVPLSHAARMFALWNRRQAFSHNSYQNKTLACLPALFEIEVLSVDMAERPKSSPGRGEIISHNSKFLLEFLIKNRFHP